MRAVVTPGDAAHAVVPRAGKAGGRLDAAAGKGADLADLVDDESDLAALALDHDDARLVGGRVAVHAEPHAKVDHGDGLAPEVDQAAHVGLGVGDRGDLPQPDDLVHPEDVDPVPFAFQAEHHHLLVLRLFGNRRDRCHCCSSSRRSGTFTLSASRGRGLRSPFVLCVSDGGFGFQQGHGARPAPDRSARRKGSGLGYD